MTDKKQLSDDNINKVTGGDNIITNVYCPRCHENVLCSPMGILYCPKCDWVDDHDRS